MTKSLLLAGALLCLGGSACGPQDVSELGEAPEGLEATAFATSVSAAALSATGCTQLTAASVIAKGHDGNVPANTMDDRLDTRWSMLGKGAWIDYDLGSAKSINGVAVAWHEGATRTNTFTVSTSPDGYTYTQVFSGTSTKTSATQTYSFNAINARRVRITVQGNSLNDWASIAEARACASGSSGGGTTTPPPPTGASVVWVGDFESGDRNQWTRAQMVSADRLAVVSSPRRQGTYALKATVRRGDDPINSSGNRNELVRMTREAVGSEYYYRWSTMFDSTFPNVKTWQLFTQWHQDADAGGSPPVEFYVYGDEVRLNIGGNPGTIVWRTPLVRGKWMDFIFHVRWSPDAKVGFVELYLDGKLVMPKRYIATQYKGMLNYLKVGLYRNDTITQTGIVYHDGWVMARKLEDVLNPTAIIKAP